MKFNITVVKGCKDRIEKKKKKSRDGMIKRPDRIRNHEKIIDTYCSVIIQI